MPRETQALIAFNAGLLSPRVQDRLDVEWRFRGCRELKNLVPLPHGPAKRRSGFRFIEEAQAATGNCRVIPFQFSTEQAYIIEATSQTFRFYKDRAIIESGGSPVSISTVFDSDKLAAIDWAQENDFMVFVHPDEEPQLLTRTSDTSWTISEITFEDGPYLAENVDTTHTMTPNATTGTGVTLTSSAAVFASTDVGRLIRLNHGGTIGYATIAAFTSSTQVSVDIVNDFGATTATSAWNLGAWSNTTGFPSCVAFHKGRLFFSGQASDPARIYGSRVDDFFDFTPGTEDDDPLEIIAAGSESNPIHWMRSKKQLAVGTSGEEFSIGSSDGLQITPSDSRIQPETAYGSKSGIRPTLVGRQVLFVQRQARSLMELIFSFSEDGFVARDLARRAEDTVAVGLAELAYQQQPWSTVWAVLDDGNLVSLTYLREEDAIGWAVQTVAPSAAGAATVESIAVIPGEDSSEGEDQLWASILRTVDGGVKRTIECLDPYFADDGAEEDQFFVDAGIKYDSTATTTITGLDHLEGETVVALADGRIETGLEVASGQIELSAEASVVNVGLPFTWRLKPVAFEAGAQLGVAQGQQQAADEIIIKTLRTGRFNILEGAGETFSIVAPELTVGENAANAPALFTGIHAFQSQAPFSRDSEIVLEGSDPTNAEILSMFVTHAVNTL